MTPANPSADPKPKPARKRGGNRRTAARLAAVQALYQMDMVQTDLADVLAEFSSDRLSGDAEVAAMGEADAKFFETIVSGVVADQRALDTRIDGALARGWQLERLDTISRALLRAGAFELIHRADVPARAVISEYVAIARSFFDGAEPGFINGALDAIGRKARPGELKDSGR